MPKKPTPKKVLILWSGGLDSTFTMCHYLEKGYAVDVVSVKFANSYGKVGREAKARKELWRKFFTNYNVRILDEIEVNMGGDIGRFDLCQAPIWLLAAAYRVTEDHDEVALSYVMADQALSYMDEFKAVWQSYAGLITSFTLPPLVFPIIKFTKSMIWNRLPQVLRDNVMWCESAEKLSRTSSCGVCNPCMRMIRENIVDIQSTEVSQKE